MSTNQELIRNELEKLVNQAKESLVAVKRLAVSEAWKILQITTASVVQILEKTATDLSGHEKKELAMNLISEFYDKVFLIVDVPFVPNLLEPLLHKYIKGFLMVLVSASIDALVTTFRQVGVFIKKKIDQNPFDPTVVHVSYIK